VKARPNEREREREREREAEEHDRKRKKAERKNNKIGVDLMWHCIVFKSMATLF